jgi:hypothetical protein
VENRAIFRYWELLLTYGGSETSQIAISDGTLICVY